MGHWWYANVPAFIATDLRARLQALPKVKLLGYYSDAYKLEFIAPKFNMYRRILADVLAEEAIRGRGWSVDQALQLAKLILIDNPKRVFAGVGPRSRGRDLTRARSQGMFRVHDDDRCPGRRPDARSRAPRSPVLESKAGSRSDSGDQPPCSAHNDDASKPAVLVFEPRTWRLDWPVQAQMTGGPGLSSGSGAGHRRRRSHGCPAQPIGLDIGRGPGLILGPAACAAGRPPPPRLGAAPEFRPFGPGVDVTFPNDPYLVPFMALEQPGDPDRQERTDSVTPDVLDERPVDRSPDERSLALQRIANGAIASSQLILAHQTLEEATTAASEVTVPLVRDQRLIAIVTSLTSLTDAISA